ncbi:MAG TPA: hypothetical protein VFF39_11420 [Verrucomicrobiae bacterium]|nr:hypothetical protein [Verrucomicrobiae bacterium]
MKKLLTIAFAMLLGATLSMAQATGSTPASTDKPAPKASSTKSGKKTTAHKGGKKSKKGSSTTTPPPK